MNVFQDDAKATPGKPATNKLPPISYSFHRDYDNCPRKAWHTYIARDIERKETDALRWGNRVHAALEQYLKHHTPLPDELKYYTHLYSFPDGYEVHAEMMLGMRSDGSACEFFADDVWFRGKLDVVLLNVIHPTMAMIIDHKTGKKREDKGELELHAVLLKAKYPHLTTIKGWYNWLQLMQMGAVYDLSDTQRVLGELRLKRAEIARAFSFGTEAFPPRQNPLCPWCPVKTCNYHPEYQP